MSAEQEVKPPGKKLKWKTLESNPEVINEISKDTQITEESTTKVSEKVYFVKQLVANACGTIADKERGLLKFIENTIEKTPIERGELLGYDDMIAQSHEASAKKGQTKPEDVAPSDFHFVCFTEVDGNLYQLDGGKPAPINRGKTSPATFLQDAARVVKENFIQKSGKELFFSILTLGLSTGEESFELPTKIQKTNEVSDDAIASITSMGFSEEQARNSLMITGNNVEQAINYLLSSM